MIVWVLFLFYIFILVLRILPSEPKPKFDKIEHLLDNPYTDCTKDLDCQSSEICFHQKCTLKLRGSDCNPLTGNWSLVQIDDKMFVKCVCKYPELVNQNVDGGDCIVSEACLPHGKFIYNFKDPKLYGYCVCDPGYRETIKFQCNRILPFEKDRYRCQPNEMTRSEASKLFEREYLANVPPRTNCFVKPCSFNVLNGKPLIHTHFDDEGCHCNPRFGNFGVTLDGKYLKMRGYNACANIFEQEPHDPIDVELLNYFYIKNLDPVSFIHFKVHDVDEVVPQLKSHVKNFAIQISEDWKNSFAQYVLKNEPFKVHTRECYYLERILYIEECEEYVWKENHMIECSEILKLLYEKDNSHINAYKLLYQYPVCKFDDNSLTDYSDVRYLKKYVLNPFLLTLEKHPELMRSNGFNLYYLNWHNQWTLDLAESDFDKYKSTSKAPNLDDGTLQKFKLS